MMTTDEIKGATTAQLRAIREELARERNNLVAWIGRTRYDSPYMANAVDSIESIDAEVNAIDAELDKWSER